MFVSGPFKSSICADEIVAAGGVITLEFDAPVDPQSAQSAVRVISGCDTLDIQPEISGKGRVVRIALDKAMQGSFKLDIAELLDARGGRLVQHESIPFVVLPLSADVPDGMRIEHAVRLFIDDLSVTRLAPGTISERGHVDAFKLVDRKTGIGTELAVDERGRKVDLPARLAEVEKRRAAKYGRIHEALHARIAGAEPGEVVPVAIWPRLELPPAPYEKATDRRADTPPEGERKVAEILRKATAAVEEAMARAGVKPERGKGKEARGHDEMVPCVNARLAVSQIRELANHDAVGAIFFDDQTAINDLGNSIAVAHTDRAHLAGFDGTGIRAAVWEDGPSDTSNLAFAGRFTSSPPASDHARLTSAIVKNTERDHPHGHAPDCDLFSANRASTDALRWAIRDQHCTVVSQSFHRSSEPGGSGLQSDDILKDWLVLRWPYPTILQAAGNFWATDPDGISPPSDEFVNHKGYNSLAIGNHDDTAGAMSGDSVFRNPTTTHGDRELPELAANGTSVSANDQTMSGTSFAAPAAAGVAAVLQDVDGVLCSWPEGVRAIMLASAGRNVRDDTWWRDVVNRVDGRDGAGAVDAMAGVTIARQRRWRDAPGTRHGWDVGTLSSGVVGDGGIATFRYHIAVPPRLLFPRLKVALAWDSAVTSIFDIPLLSRLTVDLDLIVRDSHGNQVGASVSWDNSYEVVEFAAKAGETYDIVIRRWSGTDSVWYGVAWTVTGLSFYLPTDLLTLAATR